MEAIERDTKPWIEVIDFENRRYPRFDIHLPIEYYYFKPSITHIGNISEDGLLIYFPEETHVRQYLKLKLFFCLGPELETINVLAEVVWKDNRLSKKQKNYPYGVKFVHIASEDATKLRYFLRRLSPPLHDVLCPFDILKARCWLRKFMNPSREYIPERQRRGIMLPIKFHI